MRSEYLFKSCCGDLFFCWNHCIKHQSVAFDRCYGFVVGIHSSLWCVFKSEIFKSTILFLFRDGVSESQFNQVLNIELEQIIKVLLQ